MIYENVSGEEASTGESDVIFCNGEDDATKDMFDNYHKNGVESDLDNQLQKYHSELCDQFRQILSDRQELRRKNIFLQKKMVEFFKKRKMDHVLKEDPKGLDLESKYLKRLHELEETKIAVVVSREKIQTLFNNLKDETCEIQNRVVNAEKQFFDRQKNVAHSLQLKSKKSISMKAISSFIAAQVGNAAEVQRQRFLEIKERRLLEEKQILSKTLDSLGKGLKRADYELLQFEYENTLRIINEKAKDTNLFEEKVEKLAEKLTKTNKSSEKARQSVVFKVQQYKDTESQMIEVRHRLQKLKKMTGNLRKEEENLKAQSGLLGHAELLKDFETSLLEMNQLKNQLKQLNIVQSNTSCFGNGHNNSADLIGPSDTDATNSECSTDDVLSQ